MTEALHFTAEVEALLREVARDPRSNLLRVPRPAHLRPFFGREKPVGRFATGLTAPERELVRAHRAEAAFLLRQACLMKLYAGPEIEIDRRLVRAVTADRDLEIPAIGDWRTRGRRTLEVDASDRAPADELALLEQCVGAGSLEGVSVAQLAAASLRLEPADSARIYAAMELTIDGDLDPAERVLLGVVDGFAAPIDAAYAWTDLGYVSSRRGDLDGAFERHGLAERALPSLSLASLNRFACAVVMGEIVVARRVAKRLDSHIGPDHAALEAFAAGLAITVAEGTVPALGDPARKFAAELRQEAGLNSGVLIDALGL